MSKINLMDAQSIIKDIVDLYKKKLGRRLRYLYIGSREWEILRYEKEMIEFLQDGTANFILKNGFKFKILLVDSESHLNIGE